MADIFFCYSSAAETVNHNCAANVLKLSLNVVNFLNSQFHSSLRSSIQEKGSEGSEASNVLRKIIFSQEMDNAIIIRFVVLYFIQIVDRVIIIFKIKSVFMNLKLFLYF